MSTFAADSYDEIRAHRDRLRIVEVPHCPIATARTLYECLRSAARCTEACPHHLDWIGPEGT